MARKRKRSTSTGLMPSAPRDTFDIAMPVFPRLLEPSTSTRSGRLMEVEDRRNFSPSRLSPPRSVRRLVALLEGNRRPGRAAAAKSFPIRFAVPRSTMVCVRRSMRREVLAAKGVLGRKVKKGRRNSNSSISCRRK